MLANIDLEIIDRPEVSNVSFDQAHKQTGRRGRRSKTIRHAILRRLLLRRNQIRLIG
jgi:hypothetical protein